MFMIYKSTNIRINPHIVAMKELVPWELDAASGWFFGFFGELKSRESDSGKIIFTLNIRYLFESDSKQMPSETNNALIRPKDEEGNHMLYLGTIGKRKLTWSFL